MTTGNSWSTATVHEAFRICMQREHLRRTVRIALVVGTILALINQADVIIRGDATALTWVKGGLNYCVPFIVQPRPSRRQTRRGGYGGTRAGPPMSPGR